MVSYGIGVRSTDEKTLSLEQLHGAVLKYEKSNGETVHVQFPD